MTCNSSGIEDIRDVLGLLELVTHRLWIYIYTYVNLDCINFWRSETVLRAPLIRHRPAKLPVVEEPVTRDCTIHLHKHMQKALRRQIMQFGTGCRSGVWDQDSHDLPRTNVGRRLCDLPK